MSLAGALGLVTSNPPQLVRYQEWKTQRTQDSPPSSCCPEARDHPPPCPRSSLCSRESQGPGPHNLWTHQGRPHG